MSINSTGTPDTEFLLACLQRKCDELSKKPSEKPCKGLVAFQDGLTFVGSSIAQIEPLFDAAIEAVEARFKFARLSHESQHGAHDIFAEEYIVGAHPDGQIELRAQIVLKSLTQTGPSLMEDIQNGQV